MAPAAHTLYGFSRGHWDGTTLVVETDHIAAGYFDHEGTPQSDQIKTVERFTPNADYSRLDYTLTTTDPVNFERAVRAEAVLRLETGEVRAPVRVPGPVRVGQVNAAG